jgi:hypothetical protein
MKFLSFCFLHVLYLKYTVLDDAVLFLDLYALHIFYITKSGDGICFGLYTIYELLSPFYIFYIQHR